MLIPYQELLQEAYQNHYIVGYFESWDTYSLEAVIEAAEESQAPVIIGFGGHTMNFGWFGERGMQALGALGVCMARSTQIPVSFILNEIPSIPLAVKGIAAGFNAIMLDSSDERLEENIALTRNLCEIAHACNVGIEGEVGTLGDARGISGEAHQMTDPKMAAEFVAQTEVDALSVSIGNVHLRVDGEAAVDIERLKAIHQSVDIPLVLHGGSSLPSDCLEEMKALGLTKINVGTILKKAFMQGIQEYFLKTGEMDQYHKLIGCRDETDIMLAGKVAMKKEVKKRIEVFFGKRRK